MDLALDGRNKGGPNASELDTAAKSQVGQNVGPPKDHFSTHEGSPSSLPSCAKSMDPSGSEIIVVEGKKIENPKIEFPFREALHICHLKEEDPKSIPRNSLTRTADIEKN